MSKVGHHLTRQMHTPTPWMADALCRQTGADLMYPEKNEGHVAAAAKRICAKCPVTRACLEYALEWGENEGVWGGKSATERRAIANRGPSTRRRREQQRDPS